MMTDSDILNVAPLHGTSIKLREGEKRVLEETDKFALILGTIRHEGVVVWGYILANKATGVREGQGLSQAQSLIALHQQTQLLEQVLEGDWKNPPEEIGQHPPPGYH